MSRLCRNRRSRRNSAWLLLIAADEADDLPAARVLDVTTLTGRARADRPGGDIADLAARRDHAQPLRAGALDRVERGFVDRHAHEGKTELLGDGRVGLRFGAHLYSGRIGESPFARVGLGCLRERLERLAVAAGHHRRARDALLLWIRGGVRIGRRLGKRIPARAVVALEVERDREVLD